MSKRRAATLEDIAREAGVSRATVSLALAGTGRISDETRARVRAIAANLDYSVNIGARNLRRARASAVGLYLPESTNCLAYYMDFIYGVVDVAGSNGLSVTIVAGAAADGIVPVDGYILIDPPDDDPVVHRILRGRVPVVSGELVPDGLSRPWGTVYSDHRHGMQTLLSHLHDRGARTVALIAPAGNTVWGRDVRDAYLGWCAAAGIAPTVRDSLQRLTPSDIHRVATDLLVGSPRPDAIISAPDGSAVGAVSAARSLGLRVGTDILIAAYADSLAMQMCDPPVTAIDLRARAFGTRCAELLLSALSGGIDGQDQNPRTELFPIDLRLRASTAAGNP